MDETQFDRFYTNSYTKLVGQVYAMCGNMAEAQDCVQEAFIRAWDHRSDLDASRSPEAWVRTTAYRLAVSRWRKARRAFRQPDRALEPERSVEPGPDRVAIDRALAQLPDAQRRAIVLYHLCDLTVGEIAQEVGSPTGTVKARLARGRQTLARLLTTDLEVRHA
ncbi:RNA polymerase sigma factor [Tessaracoccus sp. Z1128]